MGPFPRPTALSIYVLTVVIGGLAVLLRALFNLPTDSVDIQQLALFAFLTTIADLNRLKLSYGAGYSLSTAINLAGVIVLGVDSAVWVGASVIVADLWNRRPIYKAGFNACETAISIAAGGVAFELLRHSPPGSIAPADLPALMAYSAINFFVNHALICLVVSLDTRTRLWDVAVANFRSILLPALALFPVGVLLAVAYIYFGGVLGILLLVVPLAAIFTALSRAQQLQQQTEELAKRDAEAAALRELDRLKNEFLRTISHELRTPLTLVHGYAELLHSRAHSLDGTCQRMVDRVYSGSMQLTRLVEDLLDFARIERGELAVETQDFDLVPVLRDLLASFQANVAAGRLILQAPKRLPVHADPARMAQVISNLVENAIKYAPSGPIVVRARRNGDVVRVEVQDQGPGISPAEQSRVWEKFYRGSTVAGRNGVPGSGIGLAVVRALVEAQGGTVGLSSTLGEGCTFWIELPAARSSAEHPDLEGTQDAEPATEPGPPTEAGAGAREVAPAESARSKAPGVAPVHR
ncbi:MAG TPA: HAMP domain-containing sensor histidine kinase [Chloroflexota bacterium]|nr:HAMP domain-containing sensor histidine kinase [Chloroflexota bacterium]